MSRMGRSMGPLYERRAAAQEKTPVNRNCCSPACRSIQAGPVDSIGPIRHRAPESATRCRPYDDPGY